MITYFFGVEIFEIRYFLAVARFENIHRASENIGVSPGSLSKAIARLEGDLGVKLFLKQGRNIRLTHSGKLFQRRGSKIVQLTDASKVEVGGSSRTIHVDISAEEILHSRYGVEITKQIKKQFPDSTVQFLLADEKKVIRQVESGDAHIGVVTSEVSKGLFNKNIDSVVFKTCVGKGHPLFKVAPTKTIPIKQILEYDFVAPSFTMLGSVPLNASLDGWRDDKFRRKVSYRASGLKILEEIVNAGLAVAYLPDYFASSIGARVLNISGCPYSCKQQIKVIARDPEDTSWLISLLDQIGKS